MNSKINGRTAAGIFRFEVRRVANLPEYRHLPECLKLVKEIADEHKIKSPLHPD